MKSRVTKKNLGKKRDELHQWVLSVVLMVVVVIIASLIALFISWQATRDLANTKRQEAVTANTSDMTNRVRSQLRVFEDTVRISSSFLSAQDDAVSYDDWRQFYSDLQLNQERAAITSLGVVDVVGAEDLSEYAQTRGSDTPIQPEDNLSTYDVIRFATGNNQPDEQESLRGNALDNQGFLRELAQPGDSTQVRVVNARNQGVALIPDAEAEDGYYMVYVAPRYAEVQTEDSDLVGYTYAVVSIQKMFDTVFTNEDTYAYEVSLTNAELPDGKIIYSTDRESPDSTDPNTTASSSQPVEASGNTFTITSTNHASLVSLEEFYSPRSIIVGVLLLAFIASCLIFLPGKSRRTAISERDEERVEHAKGDFLALASHQLRTPATGVKQYLGLIREGYAGRMTARQRDFIEQAYESNERQLNIVNQMLFVARVDSGNFIPELSKINLTKMLQKIVKDHRIEANDKNQSISFHIPDKDVYMRANESFTHMALENIVNNAIKYTREGGMVRISLSQNKDTARITVQDNGVGVSEEDMQKMFQKFSRVENELTDSVSGTGIGLYLSGKIIESHGGNIGFSSKKGVGSVVSIRLPLAGHQKVDSEQDAS